MRGTSTVGPCVSCPPPQASPGDSEQGPPFLKGLIYWITALQGESEREVVRVTLECALAERTWNPYYAHLLAQLAAAAKGHRVTLQYCLWDQFKQARASISLACGL